MHPRPPSARSVPTIMRFFGYRSPATPAGSDTWPGEASSSNTATTGSATPCGGTGCSAEERLLQRPPWVLAVSRLTLSAVMIGSRSARRARAGTGRPMLRCRLRVLSQTGVSHALSVEPGQRCHPSSVYARPSRIPSIAARARLGSPEGPRPPESAVVGALPRARPADRRSGVHPISHRPCASPSRLPVSPVDGGDAAPIGNNRSPDEQGIGGDAVFGFPMNLTSKAGLQASIPDKGAVALADWVG